MKRVLPVSPLLIIVFLVVAAGSSASAAGLQAQAPLETNNSNPLGSSEANLQPAGRIDQSVSSGTPINSTTLLSTNSAQILAVNPAPSQDINRQAKPKDRQTKPAAWVVSVYLILAVAVLALASYLFKKRLSGAA